MADFMDNLLNLYARLSQCCTKQKLRLRVNLRIFVSHSATFGIRPRRLYTCKCSRCQSYDL